MDLAPKTAVLIRDGEEVTVDIDEVAVGVDRGVADAAAEG